MTDRDITLEATEYFDFTTRALTGVPTVLANTPVLKVLEANNATPITAGVSVVIDKASIVGTNEAVVVATAANGYEFGKSYSVVISTGTVNGVSVIGEVVAQFTIGYTPAQVWDRVLTGSTHNIATSAGKRLRQIDAAFEVHSGTAQVGSTGTTIKLDTGASAINDIYRGDRVIIIAGTGQFEHEIIISYNGTTKVATIADTWVVTPDGTSEFILVPASVDIESIQHVVQTGGDLAALITTIDGVVDSILTAVNALNDISATDVGDEIDNVFKVETMAELADALPATTPTPLVAMMSLYMDWRNKTLTTATLKTLHKADGTAIIKWVAADVAGTSSKANAQAET